MRSANPLVKRCSFVHMCREPETCQGGKTIPELVPSECWNGFNIVLRKSSNGESQCSTACKISILGDLSLSPTFADLFYDFGQMSVQASHLYNGSKII